MFRNQFVEEIKIRELKDKKYDAIEKYNNGLSLKQIASIINNSNDNNDYDLINLYRNKRLNKKEKLEVINKIKELTKILEDNI